MMNDGGSWVGNPRADDSIYVFAKSGNLVFDMKDVEQISMTIEQNTNKNKSLILLSIGEKED